MKFLRFSIIVVAIFLFLPTIANAAPITVTIKSENVWEVKVDNGTQFLDTGIQFEVGDKVEVRNNTGGIANDKAIMWFNNKEQSTAGTTTSTQKQTLKLRSTDGNQIPKLNYITLIVTKTPAPTNTNTNANTNTTKPPTPATIVDIPEFHNPPGVKDPSELATKFISILLGIIGLASIVMVVTAGFRLVAAGSNESQRTSAKKTITWAIGGLVFALMAGSIVTILIQALNP